MQDESNKSNIAGPYALIILTFLSHLRLFKTCVGVKTFTCIRKLQYKIMFASGGINVVLLRCCLCHQIEMVERKRFPFEQIAN